MSATDRCVPAAAAGAPILLFGMPRSGTTWLAKILDSHPRTLYRHEPDSYGRMNFLPMAPTVGNAAGQRERIQAFYKGLPEMHDTKVAATAPLFPKAYDSPLTRTWNLAAVLGAKAASRFFGELPAPLWLTEKARRQARLVTKSIESVARMGVIAEALPEARLILILRHPGGFVASMLRGKHGGHFSDSGSIGEDSRLLQLLAASDIGGHYDVTPERIADMTPLERLTWQWVLTNDKALADTASCPRVRVVRYEDLCAAPESEAAGLLDWLELGMPEQTREFIARSTTRDRSRYYSVYKDPRQAASRWREELDPDQQAAVREIADTSRAGAYYPEWP